MFGFFKKREELVTDIKWLGVDIHSHLIPGVDDGSKSLDESVRYVRELKRLGFHKLICTPHIFTELYPNSCDTILPAKEALELALRQAEIDVEIGAAAEYMIDEQFKLTDELLCLKSKYVLIEMSYLNETPEFEETIFKLQVKGYTPVIAHPERYIFYFNNFDKLKRMKEKGCLLQLNLLSVLNYYGKEVKSSAMALLKINLYDLAGTDLHHERHLNVLKEGVESGKLYKYLGSYPFKNKQLFD